MAVRSPLWKPHERALQSRCRSSKGEQALAADPAVHAALSASAGTGKTQVLTARVLRLLLQGARPESILCLTFTKAAAAEMANRIGARLAAWVRLKDSELDDGSVRAGRSQRSADAASGRGSCSRRVLDCPGGLKIQTIHAFAQSLLAAFPAEAGIVPGFQPIEGRAEQELVRRTLADLMADAEAQWRHGADPRRPDASAAASARCGAVEYLQACARKRRSAEPRLGRPTTIEPQDPRADEPARRIGRGLYRPPLRRRRVRLRPPAAVAEANRKWGAQTGLGHAEVIEEWLALTPIERAAALAELRKVVLTEKDTPRVSAGQTKAEPHYETHAGRLAILIGDLLRIQNGARLAADMAAGLRAGQAFAERLHPGQARRGRRRFQRPDRLDPTACSSSPAWATGSATSSTARSTMCWSTKRRTPTPRSGRSSSELVEEFFSGSSESRASGTAPCSWSATSSRRSTASRGPIRERFREARETFKRARRVSYRTHDPVRYQAAGARIPRPVDRRELPLGAADARRRRRRDRAASATGALALERSPRRAPSHIMRTGRVRSSCGSRSRSKTSDDDGDEGEERWVSLRDRQYADALAERIRRPGRRSAGPGLDGQAADSRRHPRPGAQPRRARLADRRAAVFGRRSGRRASTGCICTSRSRSRTCSPRSSSRSSRTTTSASPACSCRR